VTRRTRKLAFLVAILLLLVAGAALARPGAGQSYSGRSSSGRSGSGGGDGGGIVLQLLLWLIFENPAIGIPLVLLIVVGWLVKSAIERSMTGWSTTTPTPLPEAPPVEQQAVVPRGALERLRSLDPMFSLVLFEDFVYLLYAALHRARAQGAESIAAYLQPELAQRLRDPSLVEVNGIVIGAMRFVHFSLVDSSTVVVGLEFEANYVEIRPNASERRFYVVDRLRLERKSNVQSRPFARARTLDCPNCGAPLEAIHGTHCSYCQKDVGLGRFDWMVTSFDNLAREPRGPLLTSNVPETGTERPTLVAPGAQQRYTELTLRDPTLQWQTLQARIAHVFGELQVGWSTRDASRIRPYVSDNLFQSMVYWLELYTRERCRNINENARILRLELANVISDRHYDALTIRVFASGLDYTVSDDGRLLSGNRSRPRAYSEYWTLIRGTEHQGQPRGDTNCPACGAPLRVGAAGNCEYCHVKVTNGEFDWVLSRLEQDEAYAG
jgi:hypothetical protein